jgi:predicted extracellular nuclease
VAGVTIWHINAGETSVLDYNTEYKTRDLYERFARPQARLS